MDISQNKLIQEGVKVLFTKNKNDIKRESKSPY